MSGWQCPEAQRFRSALGTVKLPRNNSDIYYLYAYLTPTSNETFLHDLSGNPGPELIVLCTEGTITFQWAQTWDTLLTFHWSTHGNIPPKQQTSQGWHLRGIFCVGKSHKSRNCHVWTQKITKLQPGLSFPNRADQGWLNKPQRMLDTPSSNIN